MYIIASVIGFLLSSVIDILLIFMLVSAVMSWIAPAADHPVINFINGVTDVLVRPMRSLLMRFEFVMRFPLDLSFYLTSVVLVLLSAMFGSL